MFNVGGLRSLAASHLDSLKRRLDALHGASVRDLEASHSRITKRVKMQTQGCLQLAEEADKEHRKMTDKIAERCDVVKTTYKKFVAEVQTSTSRVCKVTVPEMAKSVGRSIEGLCSRYNSLVGVSGCVHTPLSGTRNGWLPLYAPYLVLDQPAKKVPLSTSIGTSSGQTHLHR